LEAAQPTAATSGASRKTNAVDNLLHYSPGIITPPFWLSDENGEVDRPDYDSKLPNKDEVLHLIALSKPHTGDMRGVRGVDFSCYHEARAAGFTTTFRAFLSSAVQDLDKIVHFADRDTPVVNLRGEIIIDSWHKLFSDSQIKKGIPIYSFDRKDVLNDSKWPDKYIWHGSTSAGIRSENNFCEAWRSSSSQYKGMASSLANGQLLDESAIDCSRSFIVLCIENMSRKNVQSRLGKRRKRS